MGFFGSSYGDQVDVRLDVDELKASLLRFDSNAKTLPMDAFAALLVGHVDDLIQSEGAKGTDGQWEPFAEETLRRHPHRIGGMLLQDTGQLANVQVKEITENSATVISPKEYTRFHIEGTDNMPKRDIFALNFADILEEFGDLALQELQK